MFESPFLESPEPVPGRPHDLPFAAMIRTVCVAALAGPEVLYEAMLKLSLAVEAFAPTYGLSIWAIELNEPPRVKWAEGLNAEEIEQATRVVAATCATTNATPEVSAGDVAICLPLAAPSDLREGAAIYARCVRPLSSDQARNLRSIVNVVQLAHAYALEKATHVGAVQVEPQSSVLDASLPGMVFSSRAMSEVARAVERIKDSES